MLSVEVKARQAELARVVGKIHELRTIASELFLGPIQVDLETDPEAPEIHRVVFRVETSRTLDEVAALRKEWYARTFGVLGRDCDKLRLSINIVQ